MLIHTLPVIEGDFYGTDTTAAGSAQQILEREKVKLKEDDLPYTPVWYDLSNKARAGSSYVYSWVDKVVFGTGQNSIDRTITFPLPSFLTDAAQIPIQVRIDLRILNDSVTNLGLSSPDTWGFDVDTSTLLQSAILTAGWRSGSTSTSRFYSIVLAGILAALPSRPAGIVLRYGFSYTPRTSETTFPVDFQSTYSVITNQLIKTTVNDNDDDYGGWSLPSEVYPMTSGDEDSIASSFGTFEIPTDDDGM